jgi:amino acid transporter
MGRGLRPSRSRSQSLGVWDATAMAIGGMVGGGIFTVLGVAVSKAGHAAFVCFVLGGLLAALTARSFALLAARAGRSGGLFDFLRAMGHREVAALVAWLLTLGYTLAIAVYSFTFGRYAADLLGVGRLGARLAAVAVLVVFLAVNLRGVALSALSEDVIVAAKLAVLAAIAVVGLFHFEPSRFEPLANRGDVVVLVGAAAVFVAYEGFEMLSYDYDELDRPERTFPRALFLSVTIVTALYVLVAVGSQSMVSDDTLVRRKEAALIEVGRAAFGSAGRWIAALAAILATSSAVHATLFATARFLRHLSESDELPAVLGKQRNGLPVNALFALAFFGGALGMMPNLEPILGFASLTFLAVFVVANALAWRVATGRVRRIPEIALAGCAGAIGLLLVDFWRNDRSSLLAIITTAAVVMAARVAFVMHRRTRTSGSSSSLS